MLRHKTDSWPPELQYLVELCRHFLGTATAELPTAPSVFGGSFHSERFLYWVQRHRLGSVAWTVLNQAPGAAPRDVIESLRRLYDANLDRMLRLSAELSRVVGLLEKQQIPVIAFKGPVLGVQLYGSPSLKQSGDLDLIVPPAEVDAATRILLQEGYELYKRQQWLGLSPLKKEKVTIQVKHVALVHPGRRCVVEIHWRMTAQRSLFPRGFQCLQESAEKVSLCGHSIRTLGPGDLAHYLACHGSFHAWRVLSLLLDFARFRLLNREMDWAAVYEESWQNCNERSLIMGFFLAQQLLNVPVPASLERAVTLRGTPARISHTLSTAATECEKCGLALAGYAVGCMASPAPGQPRGLRSLRHRIGYLMRLNKTVRFKIELLNASLLQTRDFEVINLSDRFISAYYLLRPFLWLRRCLGVWAAERNGPHAGLRQVPDPQRQGKRYSSTAG